MLFRSAFIDDIEKYRLTACIPARIVVAVPVSLCIVVILAMDLLMPGGYPLEWYGFLLSGLFLIIFPINLLAGSILIISAFSSIRYAAHVAKEAPINIYRLPSYGCVAEPGAILFGAFSIILSVLGSMFLLISGASDLKQGLELMLVIIVFFVPPFLLGALVPV